MVTLIYYSGLGVAAYSIDAPAYCIPATLSYRRPLRHLARKVYKSPRVRHEGPSLMSDGPLEGFSFLARARTLPRLLPPSKTDVKTLVSVR